MRLWSKDWCKNEDDFDNGYDPNKESNDGEFRYKGYTAQDIKNALEPVQSNDKLKKGIRSASDPSSKLVLQANIQ